jgi:hypothetical protein
MADPTFDRHGYPLKETLDEIALWPAERGWDELLQFVNKAWKHAKRQTDDGGTLKLTAHTEGRDIWLAVPGGWTGNEDIIAALRENASFWSDCFARVRRDRRREYYEFVIRPPMAPCGDRRRCATCINRADCMPAAEERYDG